MEYIDLLCTNIVPLINKLKQQHKHSLMICTYASLFTFLSTYEFYGDEYFILSTFMQMTWMPLQSYTLWYQVHLQQSAYSWSPIDIEHTSATLEGCSCHLLLTLSSFIHSHFHPSIWNMSLFHHYWWTCTMLTIILVYGQFLLNIIHTFNMLLYIYGI